MNAGGLVGYGSSDESSGDDEGPAPGLLIEKAVDAQVESESESESVGDAEPDITAAECDGSATTADAVQPTAAAPPAEAARAASSATAAAPPARAASAPKRSVAALLPPDFSDWHADPSQRKVRPTAPKVTGLGQTGKPAGGPQQISRGFSASKTKYDQAVAARERAEEEVYEARARNGGLSSAYDTVFRGPESSDGDGGAKRTKVNRQGRVVPLSKKEAAREAELEARLMG